MLVESLSSACNIEKVTSITISMSDQFCSVSSDCRTCVIRDTDEDKEESDDQFSDCTEELPEICDDSLRATINTCNSDNEPTFEVQSFEDNLILESHSDAEFGSSEGMCVSVHSKSSQISDNWDKSSDNDENDDREIWDSRISSSESINFDSNFQRHVFVHHDISDTPEAAKIINTNNIETEYKIADHNNITSENSFELVESEDLEDENFKEQPLKSLDSEIPCGDNYVEDKSLEPITTLAIENDLNESESEQNHTDPPKNVGSSSPDTDVRNSCDSIAEVIITPEQDTENAVSEVKSVDLECYDIQFSVSAASQNIAKTKPSHTFSNLSPKSPTFIPRSQKNNGTDNYEAYSVDINRKDSEISVSTDYIDDKVSSGTSNSDKNPSTSSSNKSFPYTIEPYIPKPITAPSLLPTPKIPRLKLPTRPATLLPTPPIPPDMTHQHQRFPPSFKSNLKYQNSSVPCHDPSNHEHGSTFKSPNRKTFNKYSLSDVALECPQRNGKTILHSDRPFGKEKRFPYENLCYQNDQFSQGELRNSRPTLYDGYPPFALRECRGRGKNYSRLLNNTARPRQPFRYFDSPQNEWNVPFHDTNRNSMYYEDEENEQYYNDYDLYDNHVGSHHPENYDSFCFGRHRFSERETFRTRSLFHHLNSLRGGRKHSPYGPYSGPPNEEIWPRPLPPRAHFPRYQRGGRHIPNSRNFHQTESNFKTTDTNKNFKAETISNSKKSDPIHKSLDSFQNNEPNSSKTCKVETKEETTSLESKSSHENHHNILNQLTDVTVSKDTMVNAVSDTITEEHCDNAIYNEDVNIFGTDLVYVELIPTDDSSILPPQEHVGLNNYLEAIPDSMSYVYTPEQQANLINFQSVPFQSSSSSGMTTTIEIESSNFEEMQYSSVENGAGVDFHQEFINGTLEDYETLADDGISTIKEGSHIVHFHINPGTTINFTTSDGSEQKVSGE